VLPVLIVGGGPTGLLLAYSLARSGVGVRIVDRAAAPGLASRAMAVQARTLEFYRQFGFADEVISHGLKMEYLHLRESGEEVATFHLGSFGNNLSPYPFSLSYPQDEHERFLGEKLRALGVAIDFNTELIGFTQSAECVTANLRRNDVEETVEAQFMVGCDGANSTVRKNLGLGFPGGTYEQVFFVADVEAAGACINQDINLCLNATEFCAIFPIRTSGLQRLIGIVPDPLVSVEPLTFEHLQGHIEEVFGVQIHQVNWFSRYRVHHRVAEAFRRGRVYICGDAGHVHSPAGGQGMNTGLGDAVNLAWKLAAVVQKRASAALLGSYEPERMAFARVLVDSTDRAFRLMVGRDLGSRFFRSALVPHLLPFALGFSAARRAVFRTVSQTRIEYRKSPLSEGEAGEILAGDRLPWVASANNFDALRTLDWQVHVYGAASARLHGFCTSRPLHLVVHHWTDDAEKAGLERDAMYLVRPDGYVALAAPEQDLGRLTGFLDRWSIKARLVPA